jgi:hypothetical protein
MKIIHTMEHVNILIFPKETAYPPDGKEAAI